MATDSINKPTNQRPNYFAGQYLLEDDFQLEQQYHIDRQKWHHHLLHISGIAEGLKVDKIENILAVNISAGSAINPQGRQIILLDSQQVDLTKSYSTSNAAIPDGTYTLYIGYNEQKIDQQTAGNDITSRRWQENPQFQLSLAQLADFIPLAKLTIKSNVVSGNIDNSIRFYSGLRLPSYDGEITLRAQNGENKSLAQLNGSLSIAGTLSVTGNVGIGTTNPPTEKLEISGGNLKVSGNISATNESLNGNLSVIGNVGIGTTNPPTEKLEISGGNLKVSGNISGTNATLTGNIGIGTTNPPTEKLEISGGNLKVSGNITATNATLTGNIQATGTIAGNSLTVAGKISANDAELTSNLSLSGAIKPSAGNKATRGIMFPENLGGGSGDAAWIRYYSRNPDAANNTPEKEQLTLEIGTANDPDDHIALMPSGNVGIGTINPAAKLQVGDTINHRNNYNLTKTSLLVNSQNHNGGSKPAKAQSVLTLVREGVANECFGNMADFQLSRYENSGFDSRTQLDLYLTDGNFLPQQVMSLRANGNVGIGTTSPGNKLSISASTEHLQLRREKTETTGDKILFIELYQDDTIVNNNPSVPEVYPSIRFHHACRYWHRIEARGNGLHFKDGDLSNDNYKNIYAANIYAANLSSCAETLQMIRGTVESNGTALAGTGFKGFTVTRNSTGLYTITFDPAFLFVPTVVATQEYPSDFGSGGDTRDNAVVVGVDKTKCKIKCGDNSGAASDRRFHFIAIGPR